MDSQLVVLGGGPGGYAAAFLAADLGMQVTLVDLEPRLGGTCLLRGCIPSKALLHVAKAMAEALRTSASGGSPFPSRPSTSMYAGPQGEGSLHAHLGAEANRLQTQRPSTFRPRAALRTGGPCGFSRRKRPAGRRRPPFRKLHHCQWIAALEDSCFRPAHPARDGLTGALELPDIPETLLVVGGGYIGLEMGTVYAVLGTRVTVVELTEGLLPVADRDLVRPLAEEVEPGLRRDPAGRQGRFHGRKGRGHRGDFRWRCRSQGPAVQPRAGFRGTTAQQAMDWDSEDQGPDRQARLRGDGCPAADRRAARSGPSATWRGKPMLAHKASHEGKTAVEAIAGRKVAFEPRAIPAVVFTDPEIAWAGLTETKAQMQGRTVGGCAVPLGRQRPGSNRWGAPTALPSG